MRRNTVTVGIALMGCILSAACRHQAPAIAHVAPVANGSEQAREFCWWAVLRSGRSADSVAGRFRRAFEELELANISAGRWGDTAWAHGGPSSVSTRAANASYESGVLAYPHGDSTHFRYFVLIAAPPGGWKLAADSVEATSHNIEFCADIARRVQVGTVAPRSPTGEETLSVWKARPWSSGSDASAGSRPAAP
jgi:hypothetical protein